MSELSFAGWRLGNPKYIIPYKEKFDEVYNE